MCTGDGYIMYDSFCIISSFYNLLIKHKDFSIISMLKNMLIKIFICCMIKLLNKETDDRYWIV